MKKKLNFSNGFLNYATIVCLMYALFTILVIALEAVFFGGSFKDGTIGILSLAIDVIFYCLVAFYFYRAKGGAGGSALYAMLCLAICTYLIPFILDLITGILTMNLNILPLISSLGVGLAYSIILIINSRKPKKGLNIALIVLGVLLFCLSFYSFVTSSITIVESMTSSLLDLRLDYFFLYFFNFVLNFINLSFSIIFMLYPIYAMKLF